MGSKNVKHGYFIFKGYDNWPFNLSLIAVSVCLCRLCDVLGARPGRTDTTQPGIR